MKDDVFRALVTPDWYQPRLPGSPAGDHGAYAHYALIGWTDDRWPNPYFDPQFYRAQAASKPSGGNPLIDYATSGEASGLRPSPHFDPIWYRATYGLAPSENALAHFLARRFTGETSPNPDFDSGFYLETYPDIRAAGLDPFLHYILTGRLEYRLPRGQRALIEATGMFDEHFYLFSYEDVRKARIDPLGHFLSQVREGRKPNVYFDAAWYTATYGHDYWYSPLTHYVLIGEGRGYAPGPFFAPAWYRRTHATAGSQSPFGHFLQHRNSGDVSPNPNFDVRNYVARHGKSLKPGRDPFLHFLATASRSAHGAPDSAVAT